ncbi:MAG: type II toxin-antitoxin system VapC family toxin [Mariprofundaceae bacterium]|nr:type II toxin-antitoxin system VapC family toxin [Mariprofundaceae bacterium]
MKIIIDTHIFLWAISEPEKIDPHKRAALETATNTVYVSSISIVELMIKSSLGKLQVNFNPVEVAEKSGFEMLDFSAGDGLQMKDMPFHHKDPFDRMLIAQSNARGIPIMTNDGKFKLYDCKII